MSQHEWSPLTMVLLVVDFLIGGIISLQLQDASKCLCSVETGSRITCITALLPAEMSGGGGAEGKVKGKKKGRKRTLDTTEEKGVPGVMDTADSSKRTVVEQGTEDGRGKSLKSVVKKKKRKAHIV